MKLAAESFAYIKKLLEITLVTGFISLSFLLSIMSRFQVHNTFIFKDYDFIFISFIKMKKTKTIFL